NEAKQREVAELREVAEAQKGQLSALKAKNEVMANREKELREMLIDAHDQLLRRDGEIQATIAKALQPRTPIGAGGKQEGPVITGAIAVNKQEPVPDTYLSYQLLIYQIKELVRDSTPHGATVLVVSKGDGQLLNIEGREGWHFPRQEDGKYAG